MGHTGNGRSDAAQLIRNVVVAYCLVRKDSRSDMTRHSRSTRWKIAKVLFPAVKAVQHERKFLFIDARPSHGTVEDYRKTVSSYQHHEGEEGKSCQQANGAFVTRSMHLDKVGLGLVAFASCFLTSSSARTDESLQNETVKSGRSRKREATRSVTFLTEKGKKWDPGNHDAH